MTKPLGGGFIGSNVTPGGTSGVIVTGTGDGFVCLNSYTIPMDVPMNPAMNMEITSSRPNLLKIEVTWISLSGNSGNAFPFQPSMILRRTSRKL
jgi:hypothetical protein